MNEIYVFGHPSSLPLEESEKLHYTNQLKSIEYEHNRLLSKMSDKICDIQAEIVSRGSVSTVKTHSRISNTSRHSEAAAEAAALATNL